MFLILTALFIIIPVIEIRILWSLGSSIGIAPTLIIVILTGIIGANLARNQGIKVLNSINTDLHSGKMPADTLLSAALVLVGGVLLITPGIMTDAFGFCLLIPIFRKLIAKVLKKYFKNHFNIMTVNNFQSFSSDNKRTNYQDESEIIEVDAVEIEDNDNKH